MSSKSKIDHTSEDILRQLNCNKQNNVYSNNTCNKSLSYTNVVKSSLSDLHGSINKNNSINNINDNFNINNYSLINNNYNIQDTHLAKNTSIFKSEDVFFDNLDNQLIKTSDFKLKEIINNDKNSKKICNSSINFKEILLKLDYRKLKEKKLVEEQDYKLIYRNINKKNNEHQENQINDIYLSNLNHKTNNKFKGKIKTNLDSLNRCKSNEYIKSEKHSNHKDKEFIEQYHSFSKSNNEIVKNEYETMVIKNNPYSNYDYEKKKYLRNKKNEERFILYNELKKKNEEILLLRSNFQKKIELIEL